MPRLIDAEVLCGKQEEMYIHTKSGRIIPTMAVPVWVINNAPVIVAEPVRHGRWEMKFAKYTFDTMTLSGTYPTCNLCGHAEIGVDKSTPYCPNCGAKMDGGNEDAVD